MMSVCKYFRPLDLWERENTMRRVLGRFEIHVELDGKVFIHGTSGRLSLRAAL